MEFTTNPSGQSAKIIALFSETFAASEGAAEGALIGKLVSDMYATLDNSDKQVVCAWGDAALIGSIIFTRMTYAHDDRTVFILSPVAVAPDHQGKGIGQTLLRHGLDVLRAAHVDVVLTYGDPNYYGKVGFRQITEDTAAAPVPLSYPHGWLGQSLTDAPLDPLVGPSRCVPALSDPAYW
ncbi:GNAT family N-acetyltransferase [Tateyamaria omphalii]|uniref:GNAT family N-acetyltransferase n=1 Tax=Tateyamaria omphalii TaxID=299262 RepID=A0A1P8MW13_9RHOB|nr:N-acetyltransferase [Tateyamaria omphalii]APX12201.1 GNAT family N-acetyltransferase [Tateyamaria omphalii]